VSASFPHRRRPVARPLEATCPLLLLRVTVVVVVVVMVEVAAAVGATVEVAAAVAVVRRGRIWHSTPSLLLMSARL